MENLRDLEKKLKMAMAGEAAADHSKYHTGIVIDLAGPEGNVFYIMGLCQKLFRQMGIADDWAAFYKECQKGYYKDVLDIARRWFGFIYINEGDR